MRVMGHTEARWCLFWEILGKPEAWDKIGHSYGKDTRNSLGGPQAGCVWVSGFQGIPRQTGISRMLEFQIWPLPSSLSLWEEGSSKKQRPLPAFQSGRKLPSIPLLLLWCLTIQFLPVCLWCLSSCCLHAGTQMEWVRVSVHGPFMKNCLRPRKFLSSSASIPVGFYSQKLGGLLFPTLKPCAGGLV